MKRRGFTLIELLAVIVILAIISLISTPIIINLIDGVRKSTFKNTAYGIIKAGELGYTDDILKGKIKSVTYTYKDGVETSKPIGKKLKYTGKKPKDGVVVINNDGWIELWLYDGENCVQKKYDETTVKLTQKTYEECMQLIPIDPTPPSGELATTLNDVDSDGYLDVWYLEQLKYIETNATTRSKNYELMRNLDFDEDSHYLDSATNKPLWTTGEGWKPLGNYINTGGITGSNHFVGNFNGNNFIIKNLYINRSAGGGTGLFTYGQGNFKNIILEDANVTGNWITGTILGRHYSGVIENCSVINPVVKGGSSSGGLIGESYSTITKSSAINVDVTGNGEYIGGFIGENEGLITESYATGRVENIYTTNSTSMMTGGFVGRNSEIIRNSYADVTVINSSTYGHIGGFAGYVWMSTVENCYSIGQVIQNTGGAKEGFIGWDYSTTVINSYWDMDSSGVPEEYFVLGKGLTTLQAKNQSSYVDWDFTNVWGIDTHKNNGYPYLRVFEE